MSENQEANSSRPERASHSTPLTGDDQGDVTAWSTDLYGGSDPVTVDLLPALLAQLDDADGEHTGMSVSETDPDGWSVDVDAEGVVTLVNGVDGDVGQLVNVAREEALAITTERVSGDIDALCARPWQ